MIASGSHLYPQVGEMEIIGGIKNRRFRDEAESRQYLEEEQNRRFPDLKTHRFQEGTENPRSQDETEKIAVGEKLNATVREAESLNAGEVVRGDAIWKQRREANQEEAANWTEEKENRKVTNVQGTGTEDDSAKSKSVIERDTMTAVNRKMVPHTRKAILLPKRGMLGSLASYL